MFKVMFWTDKGRAYIIAVRQVADNGTSTRYELPEGGTIRIRHADIISIEEV